MVPSLIISTWLLGLLSFGIAGGAIYLLYEWYQRAWEYDPDLNRRVFEADLGLNALTAMLVVGLLLLIWTFLGGLLLRLILASQKGQASPLDPPTMARNGTEQRLQRPDGSELQVEFYGPSDGMPIVLTHGWGMNSTEWHYLKGEITDNFRLIVWDLPGLGLSNRPNNRDYSLEKFARDLEAVLTLAHGRPAILLGHSIGGMITQTFCRLFPETLGTRVQGLVLTHTTYTNPVRTVKGAPIYTALERPVIVPLLYLTIWLSPLVWLMNWMSYLNGSAHLGTKQTGFAGTESWEQIEWATRYMLYAPPSVLARGMLGMLNYDATATLPMIPVPVLVIPGNQDPLCKIEASQVIGQEIQDARLLPLAPAKHMGLVEHHATFAKEVRNFSQALLDNK
jgi:pimeloyl-ACP methyl ester carboxylesterase